MTQLAVLDTTVPVVAGAANIERAKFLVGIIKIATPELGLRAQAEKDGPGSKTWAQIAKEFGCSHETLQRARKEAGLELQTRSTTNAPASVDDLEEDESEPEEPVDGELVDDDEFEDDEDDLPGTDLDTAEPDLPALTDDAIDGATYKSEAERAWDRARHAAADLQVINQFLKEGGYFHGIALGIIDVLRNLQKENLELLEKMEASENVR